ncbi:MAG: sensor domain-containing diguanylate cyclase [Desulfobacteraceae bacterium]|jgi:diguanylate cyclase (GGDEF)-like protein
MNDIKEIMARLAENDKITKKFTEIETSILTILNFKDLFEVLLTQIQEKFSIPYVWISMVDNCEISHLLKSIETSDLLKERVTIIDRDTFVKLTGTPKQCILADNNLKPYFKLLPPKKKFFIKSLAIVPLFLDGEMIGSLNQADFSKDRFKPGIDTSSLDQLGLKVSLCLSNVTAHEKLRFFAYHDPLTGLLSRRIIKGVLEREFSKAKRYQMPLTVALIDVDHFKKVNGTLGYDLGDEVLIYIANQLKQKVRKCDILFRYGPDDFIVVLPNTNTINTERMLLRFQKWLMANPFRKNRGSLPLSISLNVASTEEPSIKTPTQLLFEVERRLFRKKGKKNQKRIPAKIHQNK